MKGKRERERYTQLNSELQRIAKRDKKSFINEQCKEKVENKMGHSRVHSEKIGDIKGAFPARMGMIKSRNGKNLTEVEEIKGGKNTQKNCFKKKKMVLMIQIDTILWSVT